ncbi:MAG: Stf0 family sulfotransferase [Spirulina sp.]
MESVSNKLKRTYIICATQRSGSTLLCSLLSNTNLAGKPKEFLISTLETVEEEPSIDLIGVIQSELTQRASDNGVSGVKLMQNHFDILLRELRRLYPDPSLSEIDLIGKVFPNVSFIFMTREDKLRQAVSLSRAEYTDAWEKHHAGQAKRPSWLTQVTPFYLKTALRRVKDREQYWHDFFARYPQNVIQLSYETLVQNQSESLLQCLNYLGLEAQPNTPLEQTILKKQADVFTEFLIGYYHLYFALYHLLPEPIFALLRQFKHIFVAP